MFWIPDLKSMKNELKLRLGNYGVIPATDIYRGRSDYYSIVNTWSVGTFRVVTAYYTVLQ